MNLEDKSSQRVSKTCYMIHKPVLKSTSVLTAAHTTQLINVANYSFGSNNVEMKSSSSGHRALTHWFI